MTSVRKFVTIAAIVCFLGVAPHVSALTLDNTSTQFLGLVHDAEPASAANEATYINNLLGVPLNTTQTVGGKVIDRSGNACVSCPAATATDAHNGDTSGTSVDLGTGGWTYLLAKYDGPNFGSWIWDVRGLTGIVTLLAKSPTGCGDGCGLSHFSLYNPGGTPPPPGGSVPEPASLVLLGTGLGAVAVKLKKRGRKDTSA